MNDRKSWQAKDKLEALDKKVIVNLDFEPEHLRSKKPISEGFFIKKTSYFPHNHDSRLYFLNILLFLRRIYVVFLLCIYEKT